MTDIKELARDVEKELALLYPEAICALEWGHGTQNGWKLVVMGRLSAQCTDYRVNIVCKELFSKYKTLKELADADVCDIENIIRPCGLYKVKAADIKSECYDIYYKFGGNVPSNMDDLLSMRGVGRKIANLVLGDLYNIGGIVADTHCIRICGRLGFYSEDIKDPLKVEKIMSQYINEENRSDFCHRIVQFGRDVCKARNPECMNCPMREFCKHANS